MHLICLVYSFFFTTNNIYKDKHSTSIKLSKWIKLFIICISNNHIIFSFIYIYIFNNQLTTKITCSYFGLDCKIWLFLFISKCCMLFLYNLQLYFNLLLQLSIAPRLGDLNSKFDFYIMPRGFEPKHFQDKRLKVEPNYH